MSRIFGAVCQNGYVVRDIDAAMKHWIEVMGVGPCGLIGVLFSRLLVYRAFAGIAFAPSALQMWGKGQKTQAVSHAAFRFPGCGRSSDPDTAAAARIRR